MPPAREASLVAQKGHSLSRLASLAGSDHTTGEKVVV